MFTITWIEAGKAPQKGAVIYNGYWYTGDPRLDSYARPINNVLIKSYSGTGDTVEDALAAIKTQIEAPHSKNVDKAVAKTLAAFTGSSK